MRESVLPYTVRDVAVQLVSIVLKTIYEVDPILNARSVIWRM